MGTFFAENKGLNQIKRGVLPTIYRAMIVNVCQLSVQTQAKEAIYAQFKGKRSFQACVSKMYLKSFLVENKLALSFYGSMVAGFVTACVSLPVDMAKTRTQNMKVYFLKYASVIKFFIRSSTENQSTKECLMSSSELSSQKVYPLSGRDGRHILLELRRLLS